jgi:hypothetical protein
MLNREALRNLLDDGVDDPFDRRWLPTALPPVRAPMLAVLAPRQVGQPVVRPLPGTLAMGFGENYHIVAVGELHSDHLDRTARESDLVGVRLPVTGTGVSCLRATYRRARVSALACARLEGMIGLVDPIAGYQAAALAGDEDCRAVFVRAVLEPVLPNPHRRTETQLFETLMALCATGWQQSTAARRRNLSPMAISFHVNLMEARLPDAPPRTPHGRERLALAVSFYKLGYGRL